MIYFEFLVLRFDYKIRISALLVRSPQTLIGNSVTNIGKLELNRFHKSQLTAEDDAEWIGWFYSEMVLPGVKRICVIEEVIGLLIFTIRPVEQECTYLIPQLKGCNRN